MKIITGNQPFQRAASCFIRMNVFVLERTIPLEEEFDELDLPETVYTVIYDDKRPVATGRYIQENETTARLTRIATLKEYRGRQLGSQVVQSLENYAAEQQVRQCLIHAETDALPFYLSLDYVPISDIYLEDGVPCQTLQKQL